MAASGTGFAITLGIYSAAAVALLLIFSFWRRLPLNKAFYEPRRHVPISATKRRDRPPHLGGGLGAWIPAVLWFTEAQVLHSAGVDAAVYLKFLRMEVTLFIWLSLIVLAVALPVNLTGNNVAALMDGAASVADSPYLYWLNQLELSTSGSSPPTVLKAPDMYNTSTPPAPPGLIWWETLPSTPPLPSVASVLGPSYARYGWRYDQSYTVQTYALSNLDKTTMSNIQTGDTWRLVLLACMTWVVTGVTMWVTWKTCHEAVRLRLYHLLTSPLGAESHTVLVTDIPGVTHGTMLHRLGGRLVGLLPHGIRDKSMSQVSKRMNHVPPSLQLRTIGGRGKRKAVDGHRLYSRGGVAAGVELGGSAGHTNGQSSTIEGVEPLGDDSRRDGSRHLDAIRSAAPDRWGEAVDRMSQGTSLKDFVYDTFSRIYGNDVTSVEIVYDTSKLNALRREYDRVAAAASDAIEAAVQRHRASHALETHRKWMIGIGLGSWGRSRYGFAPKKIETFEFYRERLEHLKSRIISAQATARETSMPAAFVTFRSRRAQVVAASALMCEDLSAWNCQPAPRPDEVLWRNVGCRRWERAVRQLIAWIAFCLLLCFYTIPIAAVQALVSTNSLVEAVQTVPIVNAVLSSILPGLALTVFVAILPPMLRVLGRTAAARSISRLDHGVITWFFVFQVATVFFASLLAGTVANQLREFLASPASIPTLLGTAAPQTAIFFMSYVLAQAFVATPLSLVRPFGLVLFWARSRFRRCRRDLQEAATRAQVPQYYGSLVPADTLIALLGIAFCLVSPLIAPLVLLYFAMVYLINKYNLLYVATELYQSGGLAWQHMFDQMITALVAFQILMISLLGVKKSVAPPLIVAPLPFITVLFGCVAHGSFWPPMKTLSLLAAVDRDRMEMTQFAGHGTVEHPYVAPGFEIDEEKHRELVEDSKRIQAAEFFDYDPSHSQTLPSAV